MTRSCREGCRSVGSAPRRPKALSRKEAVALAGEAYRDFQALEDDPGEAALWRRVLQDNKDARAGSFGPQLTIGDEARKREAMEYRFGKLADHYLAKRGVLTDAEGRRKFIDVLAGLWMMLCKARAVSERTESSEGFLNWLSSD